MSSSVAQVVTASPALIDALRQMVRSYMELAKIRLTALVMVTAAVGFVVGSTGRIDWTAMLCMLIGTLLASASASALNQVIESDRDARMDRTRNRPLPAGRISPLHALVFSVVTGGAGLTLQLAMVNWLCAAMTAATIFTYVALYTPLKSISTINTLVGAVVGALPPMMGYAAAAGHIGPGAWVLGVILFIWQVPHFLALAWMYRRDYERGGYRMLPIVDPTGSITGRMIVMWSLALMPMGLVALQVGITGYLFAAGAVVFGGALVYLAVIVHRSRCEQSARRLFYATLVYLPLLMLLLVIDLR